MIADLILLTAVICIFIFIGSIISNIEFHQHTTYNKGITNYNSYTVKQKTLSEPLNDDKVETIDIDYEDVTNQKWLE